jgi:transposase
MPQSIDSKAQLWAKSLRDFENSSLTVAQFCRSVGCSLPTFYQWRRKLAGDKPATLAQSSFLQVHTKSDTAIQVKLPSGVVIIFPIDALDSLPKLLERIA